MKPIALILQLILLAVLFSPPKVRAAEEDAVLRAMTDEIGRSMTDLHIDKHGPPYFISHTVTETDEASLVSTLGSPTVETRARDRIAIPLVRVGSYELDNNYPLSSRHEYPYPVSLDDDYVSLRKWLWLDTDHAYKSAIRTFEWKKAYLNSNNIVDRLPDRTHEEPVVSIGDTRRLVFDDAKWKSVVQELSAEFKNYPTLQKSKVWLIARVVNRWYASSEGTRIRDSRTLFAVKFWAVAQADDGMQVDDVDIAASTEESKLPDLEQLRQKARALAQRVSMLQRAPRAGDYCGPVLFEGQAAAEFFAQLMAPNFGFAEDYIGSEDWRNPLKSAIGRKILSKELTLIDDPQGKSGDGALLIGTYKHDDEGMPGEKLTLVNKGILKDFCRSRLPTRQSQHSNGHSLGGHGVFSALALSTSKTSTKEELMNQLSELAKDAGLEYVLVISRMADSYELTEYPSAYNRNERPYATPDYSNQPSAPTVAYKLDLKDGTRHLVRGLEFPSISLRAFRDIQAVGDDSATYTVEPDDCVLRDFTTPSYVVGELELQPVKAEYSSIPILSGPLEKPAK